MKTDRTAIMRDAGELLKSQVPLIMLLALCAIGCFVPRFFTPRNAANILLQVSPEGLVAIGMAFVILSGGIDLSVGSIVAVTSILAVYLSSWFGPAALLVPILVGIAIGGLNGVLVTRGRIPPFIATLAMMLGIRGLAFIVKSKLVSGETTEQASGVPQWLLDVDAGSVFGIGGSAIIFLLALGIAMGVSKYTSFGRSVFAVGGNEEAASMMGLSVNRCKMLVYMICGGCAGVAGFLMASRNGAMKANVALEWELTAIAAVVISGTRLTGGVGKVGHTIYGILILGVIRNLINQLTTHDGFLRFLRLFLPDNQVSGSLPPWYNGMITGALLLAVVLFQSWMERRKS